MDNLANSVQVVQAHQSLSSYLPDNRHWYTTIVVLLDQRQEVLAEDFECHHRVTPVGASVHELVEHLQVVRVLAIDLQVWLLQILAHRLLPDGFLEIARDIVEDFLFLQSTLSVLFSTLLYL